MIRNLILHKHMLSIGLFIGALIIIVRALNSIVDMSDYEPTIVPFEAVSKPVTVKIKAPRDTEIQLYIQMENTKQNDHWACVFGCMYIKGDCPPDTQASQVEWNIRNDNGKTVSDGIARSSDNGDSRVGFFGESEFGCLFNSFNALKGEKYHVSVMLHEPQIRNMEVIPQLRIEISPYQPTGDAVDAVAIRAAKYFIAGVLLFLSIFAYLFEREYGIRK